MTLTETERTLTETERTLTETERTLTEAIASATTAWFTPGRRAAAAQPFVPDGAEPVHVDFEGIDLAGFAVGEGRATVLLVHGWASSVAQMAPLLPVLLGSGHRVTGFDLPAHGASGGAQTNVYELAGAVRAFADHVGGVDAIVAHSIGAPATIEAARRGLDLKAVAFIAPGTRLRDAFDVFVARADLPQPVAAGLETEIERRFGSSVWEDLQVVNAVGDLGHIPALLIHDPADRQSPIGGVRAVAGRWPGSRLIEVEGLGHNRILGDPAVLAAVGAFLGRSLGGGSTAPLPDPPAIAPLGRGRSGERGDEDRLDRVQPVLRLVEDDRAV